MDLRFFGEWAIDLHGPRFMPLGRSLGLTQSTALRASSAREVAAGSSESGAIEVAWPAHAMNKPPMPHDDNLQEKPKLIYSRKRWGDALFVDVAKALETRFLWISQKSFPLMVLFELSVSTLLVSYRGRSTKTTSKPFSRLMLRPTSWLLCRLCDMCLWQNTIGRHTP